LTWKQNVSDRSPNTIERDRQQVGAVAQSSAKLYFADLNYVEDKIIYLLFMCDSRYYYIRYSHASTEAGSDAGAFAFSALTAPSRSSSRMIPAGAPMPSYSRSRGLVE
jgi:hypothetical protein